MRLLRVVTIDGPAGAGKSTVARRLARRLGFRFLDTGAMYRAVTLCALRAEVAPDDDAALASLLEGMRLDFDGEGGLELDGELLGEEIRTREVTARVSAYAAHPLVRAAMGRAQRRIGEDGDLVCEGRDMGTVVFPDAAVKIYLDASPAERARRRTAELREKGEAADEQSIRAEIERRDRLDSEREEAPLRRSPEQVYVDSSAKDRDSVVAELERLARERLEQLT